MRIENGQACRPKGFPEVGHITRERVFNSPGKWQGWDRASFLFLQNERDDARSGGKNQQRNFLQKQAWYCRPLIPPVRGLAFAGYQRPLETT